MEDFTLVMPGSGLNYLWQLGGLKALSDLGLRNCIKKVYACSGGAWATIFFGLGDHAMEDWLERAPSFYAEWQEKNRFRYVHRMTRALYEESRSVLGRYGFFDKFTLPFECHFKMVELYPSPGTRFIDVTHATPQRVHHLAVASSTIPFITGLVSNEGDKWYVDGDFTSGFGKLEDDVLILDPRGSRWEQERVISPSQKLDSGLKLGSPLLMRKEEIETIVRCGYADVYKALNTL